MHENTDAVLICDRKGYIEYAKWKNDAFFYPKEVVGKHILDVYPQMDSRDSTIMQVLRTGHPSFEVEQKIRTWKDELVHCLSTTLPIEVNGVIIGALCASVHYSEKAKALPGRRGKYYCLEDIITEDSQMEELKERIRHVARNNSTVLIMGETGTGKELVAQSLHTCSDRADKPFISQNCAAIPANLLEGIFFGTEKGSYTGAETRKGLFELADGGTLFLDEINSMPLFLQSKLLRVLQDGSFRSLGGSETKRTNVKIIAATNVEPLEAIEKGQLRRDIYYRLSMMSIRIPPLRERKADIGHFVKFYVNKHNGTFHKQVQYVSKDLLKKLEEYDWPGNVRELEHVIVYGMSMVDETSALLQYKDIKGKLLLEKQADRKKTPESLEEVPKLCSSLREAVAAYEEKLIWQALEAAHGNISEAARILDVPRQTLQRKASQLRGEKAKEKQEKEI